MANSLICSVEQAFVLTNLLDISLSLNVDGSASSVEKKLVFSPLFNFFNILLEELNTFELHSRID